MEISLDNKWIPFNNLYDDDTFNTLIEQDSFNYRYMNFNYNAQAFNTNRISGKTTFTSIENEVNSSDTFGERQDFIEKKMNDAVEDLKEELYEKETVKKEMESWNIKRIFEKLSIDKYLIGFEHNELLRNLIKNGYLDENYIDYISIFHEAKIKLSDKEFIKKVKSGKMSDYDYYLTKPNEVLKEIPTRYFSRKEVLNYHVLGYLLRLGDSFSDKRDSLIKLICGAKNGTKEEHDMFKFIDGYINFYEKSNHEIVPRTSGSISQLIKILSLKTGLLWNPLLNNNATAKTQIEKYIKYIVLYAEPNELKTNPHNSRLKSYFNIKSDLINLFKTQDESQKFATIIQLLEIKFSKLVPKTNENENIFEFIYENNHYILNQENITTIIKGFNSNSEVKNLEESNYTQINNSNCSKLIEYVDKNINTYVKEVLLKIKENDNESEKSVIHLLNHKIVTEELKDKIIKKQNAKVINISDINNQGERINLLKYEKLKTTWMNIIKYYDFSDKTIDLFLTNYLNQENNYKILEKSKIPDEIETLEHETIKQFIISLIKCKGLTQQSYISLYKSIPSHSSHWKYIDFSELQEEKINFLIENNYLSLTQKNFDLISEKFENLKSNFLIKKKKDIIDALDDEELVLNNSDIDILLESTEVSANIKEDLIKGYARSRIISENKIGKLIGNIASSYNRNYLNYDELNSIFSNGENTDNERLIMLNSHFSELEESQIVSLSKLVSRKYKEIFNEKKKPGFNYSEQMEKLANNLKTIGLVKNFHIQNKGKTIRFYP